MRVLVIGGTIFIGRALVASLQEAGHAVTLFNRGKSNSDQVPGTEMIVGDRETELRRLNGKSFDVVIDTCGYVPRITSLSAKYLTGHAGHYIFISTVSVYSDFTVPMVDETSPLLVLDDPDTEDVRANYGALKVACEASIRKHFFGKVTMARPCVVAGPHDSTDRYTYWAMAANSGKEYIIPGSGTREIQYIDVRDLADWLTYAATYGIVGDYNLTAPPHSLAQLIATMQSIATKPGSPMYVPEDFLKENNILPWKHMPMWLPEGATPGLTNVSSERARKRAGFTTRTLLDTAAATMEWWQTQGDRPLRTGMPLDDCAALIKKYRAQG